MHKAADFKPEETLSVLQETQRRVLRMREYL